MGPRHDDYLKFRQAFEEGGVLGRDVIVTGAGPIGCLVVACARLAGAARRSDAMPLGSAAATGAGFRRALPATQHHATEQIRPGALDQGDRVRIRHEGVSTLNVVGGIAVPD